MCQNIESVNGAQIDLHPIGIPPKTAVWSGDGTVIVVGDETSWSTFYDFREHKGEYLSHNMTSKDIESLVAQRGGKGREVLSAQISYSSKARRVKWWESYP